MKKRTTLICLLMAMAISVLAQENLSFRRLTLRDGLLSHQVNKMARDSKGLLWLSTKYALHSYDGYRVKTFTLPDGVTPNVKSFAIDSLDNIIVLDEYGLYYLDTHQSRRYDDPMELQPVSAAELTQGQIVNVPYLMKQTKSGCIIMCADNIIYMSKGKSLKLATQLSDACDAVRGDGVLLLLQDGRLLHIDKGGEQHTVTTFDEKGSRLIVKQDTKGRIWMFNRFNKTARCIDANGNDVESNVLSEIQKYGPINELEEDAEGKLFFATNSNGIATLDNNNELTLVENNERNPFSLPSNHLNTLLVDAEGIVWGASNKEGVFWTKMSKYTPIRIDTPTKEDVVCISETSDGQLILGYDGGGLQIGQQRLTTTNSALTNNLVVAVVRGIDRFYITTYGGGVLTMDLDGRNIAPLRLDQQSQGLSIGMTKTVVEMADGRLWVGTFFTGLFCLTRDRNGDYKLLRSFNMQNSPIRTDCIAAMNLMPDGKTLIVSTSTGIYSIDTHSMQVTALDTETDCITTIVDDQGLIWVGTPQGLLLLDKKGRKIDAQLSEVSLNSQIIGLAQDGSGAIHVLTPFALTTIVKQPAGRLAAYTQFSSESLGSITFMLNSIYCNNQRQVLVGANGCYAVIPTNASAEYSTNRKVAFTSLLLDGRDLCQVANKLPAGHAITLEVTNLGYWGRAEYEYRLDGGEWTAALDNRIALGTLLPGRYTLEARLAGVDEGDTEQISFQVGEWWQHWSVKALFYLLLVAMVALVIIKLIKRIRNAKPFHVSATAHEGDAPDAQFLSAIAQAIEQNMKNTGFSVEELARLMNTSRSNLFRRVKKLTGKTPSDLIQELRLQRARQMLEQGGATVAQTAYDVGLNPRQLSSQFKKRYGMSPTQYATGQANK